MSENIKVNFSTEEADSEARSYDVLPTGEYVCAITEVKTVVIKDVNGNGEPNKNAGKHYWNMQFTVQDGPHSGRKLFTNVMLFDGALYTLAQLLKAIGLSNALQSGNIPGPSEFEGKKVTVVAVKQRDDYKMSKSGPGADVEYKTEVKGIKSASAGKVSSSSAPSNSSGGSSLLP